MTPPEPSSTSIVANGGWTEVKCRRKPKADLFRMLAILWCFPSGGAVLILAMARFSVGGGSALAALASVPLEVWLAAALLLAHPVFFWLARHYRRCEAEREETLLEPVPAPDLRKLH